MKKMKRTREFAIRKTGITLQKVEKDLTIRNKENRDHKQEKLQNIHFSAGRVSGITITGASNICDSDQNTRFVKTSMRRRPTNA